MIVDSYSAKTVPPPLCAFKTASDTFGHGFSPGLPGPSAPIAEALSAHEAHGLWRQVSDGGYGWSSGRFVDEIAFSWEVITRISLGLWMFLM